MERTNEEWERLEEEVRGLRLENTRLKVKLAEKEALLGGENEFDLIRSSVQPQRQSENFCWKCDKRIGNVSEKSKKQLVEEFKSWSQRINSNFFLKKNMVNEDPYESEPEEKLEGAGSKRKKMRLLEEICLFGPSELQVSENEEEKKFNCRHQLYYPNSNPKIEVYGNYLYPKEVPVKLIREKNKITEVDRIIFKKSCKQQDCTIFIFQCQEECQNDGTDNEFYKKINPFRRLYNISIEFSDFLFLDKVHRPRIIERSLSIEEGMGDRGHELGEAGFSIPDLMNEKKGYGNTSLYRSSFCLCILSYFPFVNFFSDILIQLIDEIKIRRMGDYTNKMDSYEQLDIKYFAKELSALLEQLSNQMSEFEPDYNHKLEVAIGGKTLSLNLEEKALWDELLSNWGYRILKMMDRDILYEVYSLIMLEETVCVIGENAHVLTFFIYLFESILVRPFSYPHPCASIVFNEELLETPFIALLGINEDSKWIEENEGLFSGMKGNKVIINLNEEEIRIKYKKKIKLPKSEKLKKIIANFYKKVDKLDGSSSSKKREILYKEITRQENELVRNFLGQLLGFYDEELISNMPNRGIIEHIKENIEHENLTLVSIELIKYIQKYIFESRKNKEKDPFIDLLMQKHIFEVYLTTKYDIT